MITTANGTYGTEASPYQSSPKEYGVGGILANRQRGSDQVTIRQTAKPAVRFDNSFDATPSLQITPIGVGTYMTFTFGGASYTAQVSGISQTNPVTPTTVPASTTAPTTVAPTTVPPTTSPPTTPPPTTSPPTTVPPTTVPPTTPPP